MNDLENHVGLAAETLPQSVPQPLSVSPAPWTAHPGHSIYFIKDANGHEIADIGSGPYWETFKPTDEANARLIAAAPDMLAALRPFVTLLDNYERICGERDQIIEWTRFLDEFSWPSEQECINARGAILKATGAA